MNIHFNSILLADYSGQKSERGQMEHIAVANWNNHKKGINVRQGFTRDSLAWFLEKQNYGELESCFQPHLSIAEKKIAGQEGWLPGIMCKL